MGKSGAGLSRFDSPSFKAWLGSSAVGSKPSKGALAPSRCTKASHSGCRRKRFEHRARMKMAACGGATRARRASLGSRDTSPSQDKKDEPSRAHEGDAPLQECRHHGCWDQWRQEAEAEQPEELRPMAGVEHLQAPKQKGSARLPLLWVFAWGQHGGSLPGASAACTGLRRSEGTPGCDAT